MKKIVATFALALILIGTVFSFGGCSDSGYSSSSSNRISSKEAKEAERYKETYDYVRDRLQSYENTH